MEKKEIMELRKELEKARSENEGLKEKCEEKVEDKRLL